MKRNLSIVLTASILFSLCFAIVLSSFGQTVLQSAYFPLLMLAKWLRQLSLASSVGNAAAIIIYLLFGALPCLPIIFAAVRSRLHPEALLCAAAGCLCFWGMYLLINPALLKSVMGEFADSGAFAMSLGICLISLLGGAFLCAMLRRLREDCGERLFRSLRIYLYALVVIIVFSLAGIRFAELLLSIKALAEFGAGACLLTTVRFLLSALPDSFALLLLLKLFPLLDELSAQPFSALTNAQLLLVQRAAQRLLYAGIFAGIGVNLIQLFFARTLQNLYFSFYLPLIPIGLSLGLLLLLRFFTQAKAIKDETDMFI